MRADSGEPAASRLLLLLPRVNEMDQNLAGPQHNLLLLLLLQAVRAGRGSHSAPLAARTGPGILCQQGGSNQRSSGQGGGRHSQVTWWRQQQ